MPRPLSPRSARCKQYVQFVQGGVIGVEAKTGKLLWRYDATKDQAANIPTPVFHDDCVFTSTSRNGSGLNRIKVSRDDVSSEQVYYNKTALNSIGGVVLVGDYLYGTDGRGELVCMEFKTGKVKWQRGPSGRPRFVTPMACSTCGPRAAMGLVPKR